MSWGHFVNDFFINLVPVTLFAFAKKLELSATEMSAILFLITTGGTFFQPLIGNLIDQTQKSVLLIYGLIGITIGMSLSGFISNVYLLGFVVAISALGSSIYHPLGSTITIHKTNLTRGKSLSVFMTIGGFAATATPLIAIPLVSIYGLKSLGVFLIPGLLSALLLYLARVQDVKWTSQTTSSIVKNKGWKNLSKKQRHLISIPFTISVIKEIFYNVIILFGVIIMGSKGISQVQSAIILSIFMLSRALATFIGGFVSDYIGEKKTIIIFNILTLLSVLLFVYSSGMGIAIALVAAGFSTNGSSAASITITHKMVPENVNYATGLIMGFASTVTAVLMLLYGKSVDLLGHDFSLNVIVLLMVIMAILGFLIPKELESEIEDNLETAQSL